MLNNKLQITNHKVGESGFTLLESILYLAIVSIILVSISYLILDILGGQTKTYAGEEINYNVRQISNILISDIKSAQNITSLTADNLVLAIPGNTITYNFDATNKKLTRQLGLAAALDVNSLAIEVTGNFLNLSYLGRTKNIGINLQLNYKNPDNLPDYHASTAVEFTVELRGRR